MHTIGQKSPASQDFGIEASPLDLLIADLHDLRLKMFAHGKRRRDRATRVATYHFRGDPPEGWRPPAKQARFRGKAGAEPDSAAWEDELAHFEKTHRANLEREAPLFAERRR
jgi:hypothetical protein